MTGRVDADGEELPSALLTEHLRFSLPYRSLFSHGLSHDNLPSLVDALVVLLVRLHLADFFWGDVSLSNVLFRRSAGGFAAYLVDAETGELRPSLSTSMREYDLTIATENVFAELLDLQASESLSYEVEAHDIVELLEERYHALWDELTAEEEFSAAEMWRIEQRIERLNDLGFDVDELDIVTDFDGDRVRIQPKVVEAGHHQRELQGLTGLHVEDAQARRLLNDIASYTAALNLGREDRHLVANRWLDEIYEPVAAMVPPTPAASSSPPRSSTRCSQHRWYLAEQAGHDVDTFEAAADYIANVLKDKPDEAITSAAAAGCRDARGAGVSDSALGLQPSDGVQLDVVADSERAVGVEGDRLDADRTAVAVGEQRDAGRAADRGADRDGVRRAAGRAGRVAVADRAVLADHLGRAALDVEVAADDQVGAAALQRRVAHVGVVDQDRGDPVAVLVGLAGRVREPVGHLVEAEPGLVAPAPEPARARVAHAEQPDPGRAVDHLAVEHGPAVVGEVVADEGAVVVVAGHRPLAVGVRPVVEGRVQRVERERLPGAAGRGVVAGVEDGLGAGRVADRARHAVHADVVVPVGDEEHHRLALLRLAQRRGRRPPRRRRGRRSCPRRRSRPRSRSAAGSGSW